MNIAIFTNNYLPNPYGVTTSIESFRRQFEKMGHKVYVFAPQSKGYEDENKNVFRFPSIDWKYKIKIPFPIPYSSEMDEIIDGLDLDIIHSQHPNLLGQVAKKWAKKKEIPLVFTWHTLYDKYTSYIPLIPHEAVAKWAIDNAVEYSNECDQVIVPTKSIEKLIQKWGVTNKNIADIPTGVDTETFQNPDGEKVRKKYGIADDEILLFSASRLTDEKNIIFLLRSVIQVLKDNNNVKFILGGEGYLEEEIKDIISDNGLREKIILTGLIDRGELKDYFGAADVFVYASQSETQGSIISEAMHSGLPVVTVDSTGSCDLIKHEKTGILVECDREKFSSAVNQLVKDENLRESLGKKAKEISQEKYTDKVCAEKMIEVYRELINSNS
ncbi:MAG: glycosyltransferase [Candidatus Moranbacteria bacterium]|nr:glycosyltransferase [Candidatus Moranbacteria bacterium]